MDTSFLMQHNRAPVSIQSWGTFYLYYLYSAKLGVDPKERQLRANTYSSVITTVYVLELYIYHQIVFPNPTGQDPVLPLAWLNT